MANGSHGNLAIGRRGSHPPRRASSVECGGLNEIGPPQVHELEGLEVFRHGLKRPLGSKRLQYLLQNEPRYAEAMIRLEQRREPDHGGVIGRTALSKCERPDG